jgi:hypothetical protein
LIAFGASYAEIKEGPARRIQEFYSDDYEDIPGKNMALELLMNSALGPIFMPRIILLALLNGAIPWIYRYFFTQKLL